MAGREINRDRPEKREGKGGKEGGTHGTPEFSWASCPGLRLASGTSGSALTCFMALGSCLPSLSLGFPLCKELPPGVIVDGSCETRAFHLTLLT